MPILKLDKVSKTTFKAGECIAWLCKSVKLLILTTDAPPVILEEYGFPNGELYIRTPDNFFKLYNESEKKDAQSWVLVDNKGEYPKIEFSPFKMQTYEIEIGKEFYYEKPDQNSDKKAENEGKKIGIVTGILLVPEYSSTCGDISRFPEAELYKEFHSK